MSKLKIFTVVLALALCNALAIPFKVETVKEGAGDTIRAGQLIKVHYKGYLYLDSAKILAEKSRMQDSLRLVDSLRLANDLGSAQVAGVTQVDTAGLLDKGTPAETSVETEGQQPFANSYDQGEPLEFTLGMGLVIQGWEKGLVGMKVGEIRKMYVPYQMAYGENSLEGIPAYSDLYFEVELVGAEKPMEPDAFPKNVNGLKWRDVAKGLKVYDEKVGSGKPTAIGSVLKTHYTGWLLSGRKFGSSKDIGKPLQVVLGAGKMIKGWEVGLDGMREGGVRWFKVSPNMGYGATAYSMIPSNSTLIFKVELVSSEIDEALAESMDFFPDTTALTFENGPEGLRYVVVKAGDAGAEPAQKGRNAVVHYTGWLTNGYKFDSSRDRGQAFSFPLGGGRVIRGWELGVQGMLPGEKRILIVPPGLGYGSRGAGPIPGGSTLIFAVEYLGQE